MGQIITIHGFRRSRGTRGDLYRLRQQDLVPAVYYGHGQENINLGIEGREARQYLGHRNGNTLVELHIADETEPRLALLKELQRSPMSNRIVHIDFQAVNLGEKISTRVPIVLEGEASIARKGFSISHQLREVEVECLPGYLPEALVVDISHLGLGDKLTVADLSTPEQITITSEPEAVVLVVMPPGKAETPPSPETANREA